MNILYIGEFFYGATSLMRMNALKSLGYNVKEIEITQANNSVSKFIDSINFRLSYRLDFEKLNKKIISEFRSHNFDLVWIDKGKRIFPRTLNELKKIKPSVKLLHINPDDPFGAFRRGWGNFIKSIPLYDYHFVAREVNVDEYKSLGAKNVFVYDRSYDPNIHKPVELTEEEKKKYYCKVGFIGSRAKEREKSIAFLIENNIEVAVRGNGWNKGRYWNIIKKYYRGPAVYGIEYAKAINGMEIALHFLRKENRDEQDSRTYEIPACGTFMLAERSTKHLELFKDGSEAEFFDNDTELLEKVKYYLVNIKHREEIARAGNLRCLEYSHRNRIIIILSKTGMIS